ncbi:hypothetical protein [Pelagibacterium sediminicola]|uniref:hypothetical protein n=1 Tax=Pelagibacterium sediminicola TaxID=2248761 RepID=UPI000E31A2B1|nr:hypothetical protein [Pelagibacterium sediminicola]
MAAPRTGLPRSLRALYDWLDVNVPDQNDYNQLQSDVGTLEGQIVDKIDVSALDAINPIANPAEATAEDVATAFNGLLAALKGAE